MKQISTMFVLLMIIGLWSFTPSNQQQSQGEYHAIFFSATDEPNIGPSAAKGLQIAQKNHKIIASQLGLSYQEYVLSGPDLTASNVQSLIIRVADFGAAPQGLPKVVVVNNFTHGVNFSNAKTVLPYILAQPSGNSISGPNDPSLVAIEWMYDMLRNQSNFTHVHMIMEQCNSIPQGMGSPPSPPYRGSMNVNQHLKKLFLDEKETVMISSKYGQVSWAHRAGGGYFSNAYWEVLAEFAEGKLGNLNFSMFASEVAHRTAVNVKNDMGRNQNIVYFTGNPPKPNYDPSKPNITPNKNIIIVKNGTLIDIVRKKMQQKGN